MRHEGVWALPRSRWTAVCLVAAIGLLTSSCGSSSSEDSSSDTASAQRTYALGHFPNPPTDSFSDSTRKALQSVLDAAVAPDGPLPGVAATVLSADRGAWSGAAGTADGTRPVEARSQFAIASITKTVLAAEVMRLAEQGSLKLDDPVSHHLPPRFDFDTNGATVENLLAMESGIPDPALGPTATEVLANPSRAWKAEEVLATVPPHRSRPGSQFVYEDANYMLLSLVIQQTTGKSVAAALRSHILADPRLSSLVYQPEERPTGPLALPFLGSQVRANIVKLGGGYLPSKSEASNGSGSGGMASDAGALARWGYLLFGGHLLSEQSLQAMTDFGSGANYDGYGLGVFDQTAIEDFGTKAVGNGGWDEGGYSTSLIILPSRGIVITVMTNTRGDPKSLVFPIARTLAAALKG